MSIKKGQFVSVWEQGTISTYGEYNEETGELLNVQTVDTEDLGYLKREYFKDRAGNEYEVCSTCHSFILKTKMNPDQVGKGLSEDQVCSNPDCETN